MPEYNINSFAWAYFTKGIISRYPIKTKAAITSKTFIGLLSLLSYFPRCLKYLTSNRCWMEL